MAMNARCKGIVTSHTIGDEDHCSGAVKITSLGGVFTYSAEPTALEWQQEDSIDNVLYDSEDVFNNINNYSGSGGAAVVTYRGMNGYPTGYLCGTERYFYNAPGNQYVPFHQTHYSPGLDGGFSQIILEPMKSCSTNVVGLGVTGGGVGIEIDSTITCIKVTD